MFVGVNNLQPVILDSDKVTSELRQQLAQTTGPRGNKQFKVTIESLEDVAAFRGLALVKWEYDQARSG